jgi:hypothetical protein
MHWFKERCNYLSFIHSLFLKQPRHNTRTEKTKTINYLQYMYIQDTKDILGKLHARRTNIIFLLSLIWHQIRQFYPVMSITEKNLCAFDKKWVDMEFHTSKFYGNLFFQKFFFMNNFHLQKKIIKKTDNPLVVEQKLLSYLMLKTGSVYYYFFIFLSWRLLIVTS